MKQNVIRCIAALIGFFSSLVLVYTVGMYAVANLDFTYMPSGYTVKAELIQLEAEDFRSMYSLDLSSTYLVFDHEMQGNTQVGSNELGDGEQVALDNLFIVIPDLQNDKINDNYIGRLSIPQLNIEDSLYYTGDDFYLRHDYLGKDSNAGELYIDGRSSGNLFKLDNLINGHSMNNGSKFGRLKNLRNMTEPVYIYVKEYKTGKTFVYQIFSASIISNENSGVYLTFNSHYERSLYYRKLKEASFYPSNVTDFSTNILTLNTCDYNVKDGHLIVAAVLIGWR